MDSPVEDFKMHKQPGLMSDPLFLVVIVFMTFSLVFACCVFVRACKRGAQGDQEGEGGTPMVVIGEQD